MEHKNFLSLKNEVEYVAENLIPEQTNASSTENFHSPLQAIELFAANNLLAQKEKQLLLQMEQTGSRHIAAAWETYSIICDPEDLLETLKVIVHVHEEYEQNLRERLAQGH